MAMAQRYGFVQVATGLLACCPGLAAPGKNGTLQHPTTGVDACRLEFGHLRRLFLEFGHFTCIGSHEERVNCVPRGFLPKSSSALSPADSASLWGNKPTTNDSGALIVATKTNVSYPNCGA